MTASSLIGWSLMLLVGLCSTGNQVDAKPQGGCSSGQLGMFCNKSIYVTLAENLHSATPSSVLDDNTKAASNLLEQLATEGGGSKDKEGKLKDLATAFSSLNDSDDNERLCGKANLANLRVVASAMKEGGNSESVSEPVLRLNRILIKLIAKARMVCFTYLDSKWPTKSSEKWCPPFSEPEIMLSQISELDGVKDSYADVSYFFSEGPSYIYIKRILGGKLARNLWFTADKLNETDQKSRFHKPDSKLLAKQLERYVLKPCDELESFEQSKSILEPYFDLLAAARVINTYTGYMDKFYENPSEKPPPYGPVDDNWDVESFAHRLRTCKILKRLGERRLVKLVYNYKRGYLSDRIMKVLTEFDRGFDDHNDDDDGMSASAMSVGAWGGR